MARLKYVRVALFGLILALAGFLGGIIASRHLRNTAPEEARSAYLVPQGDAPPAVRAGVLSALRSFQDGYTARNPKQLDAFMRKLFSR